jgi:hypothetical protein
METKKRIQGDLTEKEIQTWKSQMRKDGFEKFWTWICWVVRQHINKGE